MIAYFDIVFEIIVLQEQVTVLEKLELKILMKIRYFEHVVANRSTYRQMLVELVEQQTLEMA